MTQAVLCNSWLLPCSELWAALSCSHPLHLGGLDEGVVLGQALPLHLFVIEGAVMRLGQSVCPAEYVVAAAFEPCQTHLCSGKGGVRAEGKQGKDTRIQESVSGQSRSCCPKILWMTNKWTPNHTFRTVQPSRWLECFANRLACRTQPIGKCIWQKVRKLM